MAESLPKTREEWVKALDELPENPTKIPAFFFGHGSPMLITPESQGRTAAQTPILKFTGPNGPLATFLRDFGPALLKKYKPRAIVVFSAHWDTTDEQLVSDYGEENPLFYDYYGFQPSLYDVKFKSRGDTNISRRVVELLSSAGIRARTSPKSEPRGQDGRGQVVPGFDHGVFLPFNLMFGDEFMDVPIVEASIDGTLDAARNWALGKAVSKLREEQVLVLSGGLTIHNLRDFSAFAENSAGPPYRAFDNAILDAVVKTDPAERKTSMLNLTRHPGFRLAHPHADHFVPLYIAAGAGEDGGVRVVSAIYGAPTIAFGL